MQLFLFDFIGFLDGGAERDRTADLVNAIHALSQLSYGPCPAGKPAVGVAGSLKYAAVDICASGLVASVALPIGYCGSSGSATGPPMMPVTSGPSSSSSSRKVSSSSATAGSSSPSTTASASSPSASGASSGLALSTA